MTDESPARDPIPDPTTSNGPAWPDTDTTDTALLEEALRDALAAHAAGLLAAPFGLDAVALARARRRALRSDIRRLITKRGRSDQDPDDNP